MALGLAASIQGMGQHRKARMARHDMDTKKAYLASAQMRRRGSWVVGWVALNPHFFEKYTTRYIKLSEIRHIDELWAILELPL